MKQNARVIWPSILLAAACILPVAYGTQNSAEFLESVRKDTELLCASPSRVTGSAGNAAASDALLTRMSAMKGVKVWTHEFPVLMPILKKASIKISSGELAGEHRIYPVWPDLVRLKTTRPEGISGKVKYIGDAAYGSIPARSLAGNIAAMEMSSYQDWKKPFAMKAEALLLLGSPDDKYLPTSGQPLYFPRYYIPEGELADYIRKNGLPECTITCDAEWQTVTARNHYALVMPKPGSASLPAIAIAAAYDSMSTIMDLAPGADAALDAAFLINLLGDYSDSPPARPVLFAFIDAYAVNQLGMRQLLTMLNITESDRVRAVYYETDTEQMEDYDKTVKIIDEIGTDKSAIEKLWDKRKYREVQRYLKDAVGPELLDIKEECGKLNLKIYEAKGDEKTKLEAIRKEKKARISILNSILEQALTKAPVTDDIQPYAEAAMRVAAERIVNQAREQRARLNPFVETDTIRNDILSTMGQTTNQSPVAFMIGVDISDAGYTVGPGLYGGHLHQNETATAKEFTRWLKTTIGNKAHSLWQTDDSATIAKAINDYAISGAEDPISLNIGNVPLITSPASSFDMTAATWLTLSGPRTKVDTPQDRCDRIIWARIAPQVTATRAVFNAMIAADNFQPKGLIRENSIPKWRRAWGSVVRESISETVPRTPMPGFIVTLVSDVTMIKPDFFPVPGIRRNSFVLTSADGGFTFAPAAGGMEGSLARNRVEAYKLNEFGEIVSAKSDNTSMISGSMSSGFNLGAAPSTSPARLLSFPCEELNGPEFFDPRFLEPLSQYSLIDVMLGGKPKRAQFSVLDGQMWGLLMPETRWQLILRAGTAANRMILINLDPVLLEGKNGSIRKAMQTGFPIDGPLPSIPAHISAKDLYTVDEWRLNNFARAGISSKTLSSIHRTTSNMLAQAEQAIKDDDGAALENRAVSALANELRAYEALLATGSDVTRGAIFLMILIVPFSVAMERLLFACAKIGPRIGLSTAIFTCMTALLWSFHPAFRITKQPLVIVMAFAVLILSLFVISMIMRKFESDLEELRSGLAESAGAQTTRGGVIGSAIWLGIANMRKRKLRTLLTAITIVLITFALLCFSSSTTYQDKRQFKISSETPPCTGILIKQPSMRAMHRKSISAVQNLAENRICVPRYWWTSKVPTWHIHARNLTTGKQISLKAALGLAPEESRLSGPDKLLNGWDVFSKGNACYLSVQKAADLQVNPGDIVGLAGHDLVLAGTYDSTRLEKDLKMIDGQSLLPYDFSVESELESTADAAASSAASGVGLEPDTERIRVPPDDMIIISADLAESLGADIRSIAIPTENNEQAEALVIGLSKVLAFPMYYSTDQGTNVIVATPLIPKIPRNLLTPLILAALIIFNTMLNSVAERKKEIHIYTSLGLAPMHVGMLFLAEAATYGLMGSVFGYVAGQGVAAVLTRFDLMGGITLNYSGSSVIMTMSLVIGVVLLSAIVPAIMAGKLASPSDEMKWVVPEPVNGVISDQLPFTVSRAAAPGLTAFMHNYMAAHEEGSIGKFASANMELLPPDDKIISGISGTVWLAPYDLGVRQHFAINIVPEIGSVCNIHIKITHESGQMNTWWRQNRIFLGELRRQLLGWRKVKPERIIQYIEEFRASMKKAGK